ncbi:hypothetical protein B0I35DRAFT_403950 [Stachybotrys elegans]|uniref:Uncharacterized protein n=1 Tax=Stachybotrys elegans TaxID=80388 RepID=A0A8K0T4D5_9HYPO|nr:hypothetical protein B0I35DRAFT_403950 [Stachybotrys elegans]
MAFISSAMACRPGQATHWTSDVAAQEAKSPSWPYACRRKLVLDGEKDLLALRELGVSDTDLMNWNCFLGDGPGSVQLGDVICVDAVLEPEEAVVVTNTEKTDAPKARSPVAEPSTTQWSESASALPTVAWTTIKLSAPMQVTEVSKRQQTERCDSGTPLAEDCRVTTKCDAKSKGLPTCENGKCVCTVQSCRQASDCEKFKQCRED